MLCLAPLWPSGAALAASLCDEAAQALENSLLAAMGVGTCGGSAAGATGMSVSHFDERGALLSVATDATGTPAKHRLWRDGHHPAEWVHHHIARRALARLDQADGREASSLAAAASAYPHAQADVGTAGPELTRLGRGTGTGRRRATSPSSSACTRG